MRKITHVLDQGNHYLGQVTHDRGLLRSLPLSRTVKFDVLDPNPEGPIEIEIRWVNHGGALNQVRSAILLDPRGEFVTNLEVRDFSREIRLPTLAPIRGYCDENEAALQDFGCRVFRPVRGGTPGMSNVVIYTEKK